MAKALRGEYGLVDLAVISANPKYRASYSPFGRGGPVRYVGRAAPWKGVKGLEKVKDINEGVGKGLEKAIEFSKKHTEGGVSVVLHMGMKRILPTKVAAMLKEKGRAEIIETVYPEKKRGKKHEYAWEKAYGKAPKYIGLVKKGMEALPLVL